MSTCGMVRDVQRATIRSTSSERPTLGERTPVSTRMTEFIPERWLMCSQARRFNATVGDTDNSTSALDITRVVERPDGRAVTGEWCVFFIASYHSSTDIDYSFLGELTDVGRAVCPFAPFHLPTRLERDVVSDLPS